MADNQNPQVGAIGVKFDMSIVDQAGQVVSLVNATVLFYYFSKPDKTVIQRTAFRITPPGADGKLRYISIAGDLDQAGSWSWQGYIEISGVYVGPTKMVSFTVDPNVKAVLP